MREPTVMWWPGRIPAGKVCEEVAGTIDLLPTIAALAGAPLPERKIDGKNIVALLEGAPGATSPHAAYFYGTEGVRAGKWKLRKNALFDLSGDMSEQNNVASEHPDVVVRLNMLRQDHRAELNKNKRPPGRMASSGE
jgi:arylsulfatase A